MWEFLLLPILLISLTFSLQCGENNSGIYDDIHFKNYNVCINVNKSESFYSVHHLQPNVTKLSNYTRPKWRTKLYKSAGDAYEEKVQFPRFRSLGLPQINGSNSLSLVHFHFVPAGDFTNKPDRDETFYVENCVPGFQSINNGNWIYIEDRIKSMIQSQSQILTGQFGHLVLINSTLQKVEMYLENSGTRKRPRPNNLPPYNHIKVPEFFYKMVKTSLKNGFVVITSNNPFMNNSNFTKMCLKDLCKSLNLKDIHLGYTYCCPVKEFATNLAKNYSITFNRHIFNINNVIDVNSIDFEKTKLP
ncbi:hypothetical protein ACFFRR_004418 [Megaselia abdita]